VISVLRWPFHSYVFESVSSPTSLCYNMMRPVTRLPRATSAIRVLHNRYSVILSSPYGAAKGQRYRLSSTPQRFASSTTGKVPPPPQRPSSTIPEGNSRLPGSTGGKQKKSRLYRFTRFTLISGALVWTGVELDKRYNSAAVTRSIRTGWMG
jgi:hypothetical protein